MALTNAGITALISNAASDREQGTVLGTSSSLDSLSGILAPPASTAALGATGHISPGNGILHVFHARAGNGTQFTRAPSATAPAAPILPRHCVARVETAKIADG